MSDTAENKSAFQFCWKGVMNINECCCMCSAQFPIYKHPMNKVPEAKGSISDIMGYGCSVLYEMDGKKGAIFSDGEHGLCELFQRKKESKND